MKSILSLHPGQKGKITALLPADESVLRKFMAFGLLPGAVVEVIQVSPVYVLQIDFTQLALDKEAAASIMIAPCEK